MKVAAHIGEFTPRLRAHVCARYPYLAIPAVRYPHLEAELFCNMFYLRHLCDTRRFPDWPIPEPVLYCSTVYCKMHQQSCRVAQMCETYVSLTASNCRVKNHI